MNRLLFLTKLGLYASAILLCWQGYGQATDSSNVGVRSWSLGLHAGTIFAHSEEVQNTAGSYPLGLEFQWTKQQTGARAYNACRCYPRQGLMLSAYTYDNAVLGIGAMAAYLLEPSYRLSDRFYFSMRGAIGMAYASNPYDAVSNPTNQSYSTTLSAYLSYGLGLQWQVNNRTALQVSANFQHISNGGMKQPNKGINWPTAGLHLIRYAQPLQPYRGARHRDTAWRHAGWRSDLVVWGIAKRFLGETGNTRVPVAGSTLQYGRQVSHLNHLNGALEISYDGTINRRLKEDSLSGSSVKIGLMAGHEFLLGRFRFSQQLGWYVWQNSPYYQNWFHRWGLMYQTGRRVWLGFNLKAHAQVANFIDLRLMYSWHGRHLGSK